MTTPTTVLRRFLLATARLLNEAAEATARALSHFKIQYASARLMLPIPRGKTNENKRDAGKAWRVVLILINFSLISHQYSTAVSIAHCSCFRSWVGIPFYARPRVRKGDTRIISKFLKSVIDLRSDSDFAFF